MKSLKRSLLGPTSTSELIQPPEEEEEEREEGEEIESTWQACHSATGRVVIPRTPGHLWKVSYTYTERGPGYSVTSWGRGRSHMCRDDI